MKNLRNFAIAALCVIGFSMPMTAQTTLPQKGYYLGIATGASMGTCTFRSYSDNGKTARAEYGISAGYRFSPFFSLDIIGMRGNVEMTPMDCCTEQWLSVTGQMFASKPTASELASFWKYSNLTTETKFARFSLQCNFNLLYIFGLRDSRWKFDVSPMIGGIQTHTTISGKLESGDFKEQKYASQWHFAYGGHGSFGVALDNNIEVRIYGGVNFLYGERFDNLPQWQHTENLMYEGGAKLIWNFGNSNGNKIDAVVQDTQLANDEENVNLSGIEERLDMIYNELTQLRAEGIVGSIQGLQVQGQGSEGGDGSAYSVVLGGYPFSIFFNLNSAELKSDNDRVNLKTFAQFAKKYDCKIRLRGTCDEATGSADYNRLLSQRRCNTVKDELVRFGLDAQDIVIEAAGGVSEFENIENNRRVFLDFVK